MRNFLTATIILFFAQTLVLANPVAQSDSPDPIRGCGAFAEPIFPCPEGFTCCNSEGSAENSICLKLGPDEICLF
ncbi:hypothetical protein D9758_015437 [Tetrapyrgos nigripes]|uniref:Uncharacterized protein n=1 Tax=Tetrapyrgos nigripes TaxID=182062 RepID=A0A8H5FNS2_9AGAR|nr:hypothetical protein D9758_015437 [Tetrapyrgos nigripes]